MVPQVLQDLIDFQLFDRQAPVIRQIGEDPGSMTYAIMMLLLRMKNSSTPGYMEPLYVGNIEALRIFAERIEHVPDLSFLQYENSYISLSDRLDPQESEDMFEFVRGKFRPHEHIPPVG